MARRNMELHLSKHSPPGCSSGRAAWAQDKETLETLCRVVQTCMDSMIGRCRDSRMLSSTTVRVPAAVINEANRANINDRQRSSCKENEIQKQWNVKNVIIRFSIKLPSLSLQLSMDCQTRRKGLQDRSHCWPNVLSPDSRHDFLTLRELDILDFDLCARAWCGGRDKHVNTRNGLLSTV